VDCIGVIALRFPEIFGVGCEATNEAPAGNLGWQLQLMPVLGEEERLERFERAG